MQKILIRLRAFEDKSSHPNSKKFCVTCGTGATQELCSMQEMELF